MKRLKRILCALLALTMTAALFACGQNATTNSDEPGSSASSGTIASPDTSASSGGTSAAPGGSNEQAMLDEYVVRRFNGGWGSLLAGLMPNENLHAADLLFDRIFVPDPVNKTITSRILTDWYTEDGGRIHILKMRDDVYFSNGEHATAEDLVYSYTSYRDRLSTQIDAFGILWDECEAIDEYTAKIVLEKPYAGFYYAQYIPLYSKKWCEENGWDQVIWLDPIGSGPYYLAEYEQDVSRTFKLRDDYWYKDDGPFYVDEWQLVQIPDRTTAFMEFEVGTLDMCIPTPQDYTRYLRDGADSYNVVNKSAGTTVGFYFGMIDRFPLWQDQKLREAIMYAIDFVELGETIYQERYIPNYSATTSGNPNHIEYDPPKYDPELSKQMLAECGYGPDNPLVLQMTQFPTEQTGCEAIQYYLGQVGVTVNLDFPDMAVVASIYRSREGNDIATWFAMRGSPFHETRASMPYAGLFFESFEYIDDDEFQEAYWNMMELGAADPAEMSKWTKEIQRLVHEKTLYVPFGEFPVTMAYYTDKFQERHFDYFISGNVILLSEISFLKNWL